MKILLLLLLTFQKAGACDPECPCPNLEQYVDGADEWYTYEEYTGCSRSLVCTGKMIAVEWDDTNTNIPYPEVGSGAAELNDKIPFGDLPMITEDIFTGFGVVCENSSWMVTKFPKGIFGLDFIPPEEANGKGYKAQVKYFGW